MIIAEKYEKEPEFTEKRAGVHGNRPGVHGNRPTERLEKVHGGKNEEFVSCRRLVLYNTDKAPNPEPFRH